MLAAILSLPPGPAQCVSRLSQPSYPSARRAAIWPFQSTCLRTYRPPYWLVSFHMAVLDMDVYNAPLRNKVVAVREWIFARYQRICRIPYELQIRMIHGFENGYRLGGGSKIAGMLVLETDNQTLFRGLIREIRLGARDLVEAFSGSTVRQYENTRIIFAPKCFAISKA